MLDSKKGIKNATKSDELYGFLPPSQRVPGGLSTLWVWMGKNKTQEKPGAITEMQKWLKRKAGKEKTPAYLKICKGINI